MGSRAVHKLNCCDALQRVFEDFRAKVMHDNNKQKLFVVIVDEAHHAAVRRGAHGAYVNDLKWRSGTAEPEHGAWQSKATSPQD